MFHFPHSKFNVVLGGDTGQQSLLANDGQRDHVEIEMQSSLPPQWVEEK